MENLPLSLWIGVWGCVGLFRPLFVGGPGNRILRRIPRADASDDVLEHNRVRRTRERVRSQVANRSVEFPSEAHDGRQAFWLAFGGLVDELNRDRFGPRNLFAFCRSQ